MKNVLLIITLLLFVQCEKLFDGYWGHPIKNLSRKDILFGIDVNVVKGNIYARESYYDPADNFLEYTQHIRPGKYYVYTFYSNRNTHITVGDTVSVYAIDPIDMEMYSWDEIREKKKYSFARVVIGAGDGFIYYPFELNE